MRYTTILTKEKASKAVVDWLDEEKYITVSFMSKEDKNAVINLIGFKSYPQVMKFTECLRELDYKLVGKIDLVERERLDEWFSIANPDVMKFTFTWDMTVEDLLKGL